MAKTKAEVRDRAASELGRLRLGQSLQHQDKTRIEAAYDEVYADLKVEGLNTWASDASVPDELVPFMSGLVALRCVNTYGVSPERFQRIVAVTGVDGERAKREIRRLVTPRYESAEEPTDF